MTPAVIWEMDDYRIVAVPRNSQEADVVVERQYDCDALGTPRWKAFAEFQATWQFPPAEWQLRRIGGGTLDTDTGNLLQGLIRDVFAEWAAEPEHMR